MPTKSKMDWKIWGKKLAKNTIYIFIAGLAAVYGDNNYYLMVAPLLAAIENYLRHR